MRKLVMLAAMLSLVAVVAVPAALAQGFSHDRFEQRFGHFFNDDFFKRFKDARFERQAVPAVEQSFEQKVGDTGDVDLSLGVLNTGNNSNQCTAPM